MLMKYSEMMVCFVWFQNRLVMLFFIQYESMCIVGSGGYVNWVLPILQWARTGKRRISTELDRKEPELQLNNKK